MCLPEFVHPDQKIAQEAQPPVGDFFILTWSLRGSIFLFMDGK